MNHRKFKRFKEKLNIKYTILSTPSIEEIKDNWNGESQTLDISEGGILFTYDSPLPVSSFIEIEIAIEGIEFPIYLTGKVTRVTEVKTDQEYEIGLVFKNVFDKDKEILLSHLEEIQ
ncbi:MAG: hypothetical protein IEMM0008_1142 [bacterium]|nr:MAG: hypothetical protein IEMM0008_1142 [bacterium]